MSAPPVADSPAPPIGAPLEGPGEPLQVIAELAGAVAIPWGPIALDGLLAWATCARLGMAAPVDRIVTVGIPVALEPDGRFHLASFSIGEVEQYEQRWVNRRFPVPEAQAFAVASFRRINISAGAQKSYRIPLETCHLQGDQMTWFAQGDRARVAKLLDVVTHLGKRRGAGHGKVRRWSVAPCEAWPGFPVVRDGAPLRPLPADWPGLREGTDRRHCRLTFPYWLASGRVECTVPGGLE